MKTTIALFGLVLTFLSVVCVSSFEKREPEKPVWPIQFDAPFGMSTPKANPPIVNTSSHFYYNWDIKASTIVYHERCLPGLWPDSDKSGCTIWFLPAGVYIGQEAVHLDCCLLIPGVGSVPPEFLKNFKYDSIQLAEDYYGVNHTTYYWTGIDGFAYWTDAQTKADIKFKDGETGIFWNFGELEDRPQDNKWFTLPRQCGACHSLSPKQAVLSLSVDPMIRLSLLHQASLKEDD